jgi:hypothetical protein
MGFTPYVATIGNLVPPVPVADGGTGASTAAAGLAALGGLTLQSSTPAAGTALSSSSPVTLASWTAPNDGNLHQVFVYAANKIAGGTSTGGPVGLAWTQPDGTAEAAAAQVFAGSLAAGENWTTIARLVEANTTTTVEQSGVTTGTVTVTVWATMWGI